MQLDEVISNPRLIGVCGATLSETTQREVHGIQANGRDGLFDKAGEKENVMS